MWCVVCVCVCNGNYGINTKFTAKMLGSNCQLKLLGMKIKHFENT